ncbi:hypothetical protein BLSTO_04460 [Blastocystis sp. subtype 1]
MTPFFHPYYINYGYNKVFFYRQLAQEKRFHFYVLQQAFAVDIPHPREARRSFFVQNKRNIMTDLYHAMTKCSVCC